jgi:hypothetical protein
MMRCRASRIGKGDLSFSSQVGVDAWVSLGIAQALANRPKLLTEIEGVIL